MSIENKQGKKIKESFIRLSKRSEINSWAVFGIKAGAVLLTFLIIMFLTAGLAKISPFTVLANIGKAAFKSNDTVQDFLIKTCMLLLIAIALTPAYKMKFWNIGAQGQVLIGSLCASIIVKYLGERAGVSNGILLILMVLASIIGGGIWAFIPAFFKVKYNSNETLFTLMMNYIAIQLSLFFIDVWKGKMSGLPNFTTGYLPSIFGGKYVLSFIITIVFVFFIFAYMKYTKHGYELALVGESINTAKYAGVNTTKVILRTIVLSGAICGLCGFLYVGNEHQINVQSQGIYGFTAIIVTWSAGFNPFIMAIWSFVIIFFEKGSAGIYNVEAYNINAYISNIYVAIFLFLLIGCEFFINYKLTFNLKKKAVSVQEENK